MLSKRTREELGIDPDELGSPVGAAASSFGSFAVGAFIPIIPWFVGSGVAAGAVSLALALIAAVLLGAAVARLSANPPLPAALRQAGLLAAACAVTWLLGRAVGVAV